MLSTLGLFGGPSLWDYVSVIFATIPKMMYFLYTCLASVLDVLQTMIRKLAGLDVYYVDGTAVRGQDPVTEFIYGILGIGDKTGKYSVLNTTFWSLAIFGVIVLVIATMVAIVKAHYNEDSVKTSPITYVYTALKAVFTFALVPLTVILGITLSQFFLKTLDNITTGTGTTGDAVEYVYGAASKDKLLAGESPDGTKDVYGRYDYFGFGDYSVNTTFSGSVFKAAAYSCNRLRTGDYVRDKFPNPKNIFGQEDAPSSKDFGDTSVQENWQEWVAYQIDYAFQNNLNVKGAIHAYECANTNNKLITIASVDMFGFVGVSDGFSKFNVGLVWYFYQLWQFNFLIGFASLIISVGIMVSVILSLMSRLIKTTALFIIYPSILGLAPLDNFKAFGTWRTEFISQILMAFGAIIGMNLFFLIIPYISNIAFFNIGLLDYMVNILIIIAGLLMMQGFISFLSGLIGGADAGKTGDDLKKGTAGLLAKAGGMTLGAASIAGRAGVALSPAFLLSKMGTTKADHIKQKRKAKSLEAIAVSSDPVFHTAKEIGADGKKLGKRRAKRMNNASIREGEGIRQQAESAVNASLEAGAFSDVYNDALKQGKSKKQARSAQRVAIQDQYYKDNNLAQSDEAQDNIKAARQIRVDNVLDEVTGKGAGRAGALAKRHATDMLTAFGKGLENALGTFNINTKAITGVFTNLSPGKFDKDTGAQVGGNYSAPGGNIFREMFTFSNPVKPMEKTVKPEEAQTKAADASIAAATAMSDAARAIKESSEVLKSTASEMKRAVPPSAK